MEQIVKLFVHQSYVIEEDLVVDYCFEKEIQNCITSKDWIALIPKGWMGVDSQVAFKHVTIGGNEIDQPIKFIVMEKSCFQNVVECGKQYQLMYIDQYLEILGRSDYFTFFHQNNVCHCISSSEKSIIKDQYDKKMSMTFRRRSIQRLPQPLCKFDNNGSKSQTSFAVKNEVPKVKQWSSSVCTKCKAPNNYITLESTYLTTIQDLAAENEVIEQRLLKVEKDLAHTLAVVNKQLNLNKVFSSQEESIKKIIDNLVEGLIKQGRTTFWSHGQEFTVAREFLDPSLEIENKSNAAVAEPQKYSREAYLKAIIGQQEQSIQHLVNKIKDSFDLFLKLNSTSTEHDLPVSETSETKLSNIGYMDSSGTTYFTPPYIHNIDNINNSFNLCVNKNLELAKTEFEQHKISNTQQTSIIEVQKDKKTSKEI
ncbi:uncharacterized protein LOC126898454 isoform X2 [Daktulosphaira vitifoliae]|nr:uncharacterized protein LOC126898454 isoform X2 [Daktulosphaira vitifoliae]